MSELQTLPPRSRLLLDPAQSALIVIDIQTKLVPKIHEADQVIAACQRLIQVAKLLHVPILASEQYPEKLGTTVAPLIELLDQVDSKRMFSCRELWPKWSKRLPSTCRTLVLCGIEAHVCVFQTAIDFLALGFDIIVPIDAVGARYPVDHQAALRRLELQGITLASSEMLQFEWCQSSLAPEFKALSDIVKSRT